MKAITSLLLLFFCSTSYSSDRYHAILNNLTSQKYIIEYSNDRDLIIEKLYSKPVIIINKYYLDKMTDSETAFMIAHEIGHHVNKTSKLNYHHYEEFIADKYALELTKKSGYSINKETILSIVNKLSLDIHKVSSTHPSWNCRINKLFTEYSVINESPGTYYLVVKNASC